MRLLLFEVDEKSCFMERKKDITTYMQAKGWWRIQRELVNLFLGE
jgi:hypothetical protein